MRIDSREEESPEDEKMVLCHAILGNGQHARGGLHLGLETRPTCGRNVKRACRRRGVVGASREDETPEGWNPKSVTCLKMAGRRREEKVAERLRKPASGTVVEGVGALDGSQQPLGSLPFTG
jgi:hypothetical protein